MHFPRRNIVSALIACGVVLIMSASLVAISALPNDEPTRETATTTTEAPTRYEERGFDSREELDQAKDDYAFALAGLWKQNYDFKVWTEAAWNAHLAELAAQRPVYVGGTYGGVGDCSGFAIPDYIIERESGGNPQAVNAASGAYGCAQVMPMHWEGGACDGMDRTNVDHQRECVNRLSSGGSNLQPWAATL